MCFANEINVKVSSGDDLTVEIFPAKGKYLILWLAPEYGLTEFHRTFAKNLSKQNIEVWQVDIAQSLFLPRGSTSLKNLDGHRVADLIEQAHTHTKKKIILIADSYASLNALLGAHQWQQRASNTPYLIGAILFSPSTYVSIPPLGQLPEYMPIISSTNIPIMIYQGQRHANTGQFENLVEKLQQHGNAIYTRMMPTIFSLFFKEREKSKQQHFLKTLPLNIKKMISVLSKHSVPSNPVKITHISKGKKGIDVYLKKYQGSIKPFKIKLKNAFGKTVSKTNYKGKITVINFWATWCPPCVKEIPSLNRLKNKMVGLPFELISINYAEDQKTILNFLKKVNVEFPVLLDLNGDVAKKWNVIAYPSTFVIDTQGEIKYGVNAAIEWDSEEFITRIKTLL